MRLLRLLVVIAALCAITAVAQEEPKLLKLTMTDGSTVTGSFFSASDTGLIMRGEDGRLMRTITWFKLTQESLKQLRVQPKAQQYVELLIEPPPGTDLPPAIPPLELTEPPKPPRPEKVSLFAGITTPAGLAMTLILLLANLYAAYEIALYRNRKIGLVVGTSAVVPFLGPLIFLVIPTRKVEVASATVPLEEAPEEEEVPAPEPEAIHIDAGDDSMPQPTYGEEPAESAAPPADPASPMRAPILDEDEAPSVGLRLAKRENVPVKAELTYRKTFKRGDQPINRRFFEGNFSGFFKIAPSDPEKDLVMVFKTARGQYIGARISRIANDDLHLQKRAGDATTDVQIPFNDVLEVTVRHRDAVQ